MARTKKELQDQIPEEAQIVADASLTELGAVAPD